MMNKLIFPIAHSSQTVDWLMEPNVVIVKLASQIAVEVKSHLIAPSLTKGNKWRHELLYHETTHKS